VAKEEMRKKSLKFVATSYAEGVAKACGARKFMECSAKNGSGVDDVFEASTRAAMTTFESRNSAGCCTII